jgi:hypothetical protein
VLGGSAVLYPQIDMVEKARAHLRFFTSAG